MFDIFPNGEMIFTTTLYGIEAFAYSRGNLIYVGSISINSFQQIRISNDGNLVALHQAYMPINIYAIINQTSLSQYEIP